MIALITKLRLISTFGVGKFEPRSLLVELTKTH